MEILAKIFDIINNRISVPVALFCITLLVIPDSVTAKMGISKFVESNKGILWLFFLFSIFLYSYEKVKKYITSRMEKKASAMKQEEMQKRMISNLSGLTQQELAWIYYCLRENERTVFATAINPTAISLVNKLIVTGPNTQYDILNVPFTIRSDAWQYLIANKDDYCPQEMLNNLQHNRAVNEFISNLRSVI